MEIDISQIIQRLIQGRKVLKANFAGNKLAIICPFHGGQTPSFCVDHVREQYSCLGCKKHGTLQELYNHLDDIMFNGMPPLDLPKQVATDVCVFEPVAPDDMVMSNEGPKPVAAYIPPRSPDLPTNAVSRAKIAARKKKKK